MLRLFVADPHLGDEPEYWGEADRLTSRLYALLRSK